LSLRRLLNPVANRLGFYTAYTLDRRERVGTLPVSPLEWSAYGYTTNPSLLGVPLSAAKIHPETNKTHDISLRKVDPQNKRKQWHIHVFKQGTKMEVFSHYEFRPDPTTVGDEDIVEMKQRLKTHYRPEWGDEYRMGVVDSDLKQLL